jgi:hypothetical protein
MPDWLCDAALGERGGRMQLESKVRESDPLRPVLQRSLVAPKREIHATVKVTFRRGLAHAREMLEAIHLRLPG